MDVCESFGRLAGHPYILCCKNFSNVGHHIKCFIPAVLLSIMDFYHFIPLSLTLSLPGNHKVSAKQNLLASVSLTHFSTDEDEIWDGVEAIKADHPCCRDCLHRIDWLDRSRLFQKTIGSCQYFSTHLKTCVVPIDLKSDARFLI